MKVIGAGFARTGTLSMQQALNDLGFGPTYHMNDVFENPSHAQRWLDFGSTGTEDWDDLFVKYRSAVDFPASLAWKQIHDTYPEVKVVLTVRDVDKWYDSMTAVIWPTQTMFPYWLKKAVPFTQRWLDMVDKLVWTNTFDGRFQDRAHATAVFEQHIENVKAHCDPDRLLVFNVAEGWEPLCAFLDVPVPTAPFPHLNDTESLKRRFAGIRYGTRIFPVAVLGAVIAAVARRTKEDT